MEHMKHYHEAAYWDKRALDLSDSQRSMWPNERLNEILDKEQKEAIWHIPLLDKDLLEIGCGTGRFAKYFSS